MQTRTLGRTDLNISILGMGTGGHDPLGAKSGRSEDEMVDLLKAAYDMGITHFDTSPGYADGRSERLLGRAAREIGRDKVSISTKIALAGSMPGKPMKVLPPAAITQAVDESLARLGLDHIDIMLMAVADVPEHFGAIVTDCMPVLLKLRGQGKIRFLGSSEQTRSDGDHQWLQYVLPTDEVDVAMVGHNMINQSAQRTIFPLCQARNIGVFNIFTVRNLFWNPPRLREVIADLKAREIIDADAVDDDAPLDWLLDDGCETLVEAAYRYAAYTPGVTTVMCGTIDRAELEEDVRFVAKGPLPLEKVARLARLFGHIAEAIGN